MSVNIIIINLLAIIALAAALYKDKSKAKKSLKIALKSFVKILPVILIIVLFIGLFQGFVPPEKISSMIGERSGIIVVLLTSLIGAVMHIPSIVSFPLAASMLQSGAPVTTVAAFIVTLTMIGFVTLPLEIKELGKKFAIMRNGFSFIIALIIAVLMGWIL